ncbi:uncharacterized protein LOC122819046 isoform X2 [Drosophila biarmipes]|uniref:uncharacterized protein LOC122819046 isoform X2 n=1 Tax=Drosophila biarmipes TaxID=125945 RepID=UPI0021CD0AD4|nr:uncharacterized protein LOC122819046 isoform X2 [Drosophila biarmipes]
MFKSRETANGQQLRCRQYLRGEPSRANRPSTVAGGALRKSTSRRVVLVGPLISPCVKCENPHAPTKAPNAQDRGQRGQFCSAPPLQQYSPWVFPFRSIFVV